MGTYRVGTKDLLQELVLREANDRLQLSCAPPPSSNSVAKFFTARSLRPGCQAGAVGVSGEDRRIGDHKPLTALTVLRVDSNRHVSAHGSIVRE